jgi:molybdenum cofactor cytidylyltransferase
VKFGNVSLDDANGAYLAHALSVGTSRFKKGTLLGGDEIAALKSAGIAHAIVARLDLNDLAEDAAATRLAALFQMGNIRLAPAATGRVNIYAQSSGLFVVNKAAVDAFNSVDPAITLATLAAFAPVSHGQMVGTVKIIPFAVEQAKIEAVERAVAAYSDALFYVAPWRPRKVGLVSTLLPSLKTEVIEKTNRVLSARLAVSGSEISSEKRVSHDEAAVAAAVQEFAHNGAELIIVFGASAVVDPYDVIPQGIRLSGGSVSQVGMPVDPGNLLVLGECNGVPVIGAPGCARSPKENGFDWILDRAIVGIEVKPSDFASMGVGGLLMEIETRPRPRELGVPKRALRLAGLLLAAGRSSRMGGSHKLRALFDGMPLIEHSMRVLSDALGAAPLVVLGHEHETMQALLPDGTPTSINPDYAEGLSTSLRTGIIALAQSCDGVLVHLADMPAVTSEHVRLLAQAFKKSNGLAIIRATHSGKRGNPVILPMSVFSQVSRLTGDMGARAIIEGFGGSVIDVELGAAASLDVDTPEALMAAGGIAVS